MMRTATPSRVSQRARTRPVGPAPTMSTSGVRLIFELRADAVPPHPFEWGGMNEQSLVQCRLLLARRIVGLEVSQRVLHAGQQMLEQRLDRVLPLVVADGGVEHAPLPFLLDPAQAEVVVRPHAGLLQLVHE